MNPYIFILVVIFCISLVIDVAIEIKDDTTRVSNIINILSTLALSFFLFFIEKDIKVAIACTVIMLYQTYRYYNLY